MWLSDWVRLSGCRHTGATSDSELLGSPQLLLIVQLVHVPEFSLLTGQGRGGRPKQRCGHSRASHAMCVLGSRGF